MARDPSRQTHPRDPHRFIALDLLRGIAALCVLVWHSPWSGAHLPLGRAYLAVDLFFVLSGFVIAHAYERRLETGTHLKQFYLARLIRLYPLYCVATLMSGGLLLAVALFGKNALFSASEVLRSLGLALLFLPAPGAWSPFPQILFPLVFTAWSLFWELLVNILYGALAVRLRRGLLLLLIAIGAFGIGVALYLFEDLDRGWGWDAAWSGAPRALFSFFAGVAIFRIRQRYPAPASPALVIAAVLGLVLVPESFGGFAYDAACVFLLFPLLVWLGADAELDPRLRSAGLFVGYLSYPIYLLQAPLGFLVHAVEARVAGLYTLSSALQGFIYVSAIVLGSWIVAHWFDSPVRDWLRRRFTQGSPRPGAQTAP